MDKSKYCKMSPFDNIVQPSIATNRINFIGVDMVTGLIIIIPNVNRTLDITRSTTTKGVMTPTY